MNVRTVVLPADDGEDSLQVLHVSPPLAVGGLFDHQVGGTVQRCQHLVHDACSLLAWLHLDVVVVGEP